MAGTFKWITEGANYAVTSTGNRIVAPYPTTDASFPLKNLGKPDRFVVAGFPAGVGDVTIHVDLLSPRTIDTVGILGISRSGITSLAVYVWCGSAPDPKTTGTVLNGGNPIFYVSLTSRDFVYQLPNALTYRYWDFLILFQGLPMTIGKLLLSGHNDLGFSYSPGASEVLRKTRVRTSSVMGADVIAETGLPVYELGMQFANIPQSTRDTLMSVVSTTPVTLIHPTVGICEAELIDDSVSTTHLFGPPDLYSVDLKMRTLP